MKRRAAAALAILVIVLVTAGALLYAATIRRAGDEALTTTAMPTPAPGAIMATRGNGALVVTLQIAPAELGPVHFFIALRDRGRMLSGARVQLRLRMPSFPGIGVSLLMPTSMANGYGVNGNFGALGHWRAEVIEQSGTDPKPAHIAFDFLVGPNAGFLTLPALRPLFGPATVQFRQMGAGDATLRVHLRAGLRVRYVLGMPSMPEMGTAAFAVRAEANGWYSSPVVFGMSGVLTVNIEARDGPHWGLARRIVFDVGSSNRAELVTASPIKP